MNRAITFPLSLSLSHRGERGLLLSKRERRMIL